MNREVDELSDRAEHGLMDCVEAQNNDSRARSAIELMKLQPLNPFEPLSWRVEFFEIKTNES